MRGAGILQGRLLNCVDQTSDHVRLIHVAHSLCHKVAIEAVFFKAAQVIAWRELQDISVWRQGWV